MFVTTNPEHAKNLAYCAGYFDEYLDVEEIPNVGIRVWSVRQDSPILITGDSEFLCNIILLWNGVGYKQKEKK